MERSKNQKSKKVFEWVLVLVSFYVIFSLARGLWELSRVSERLDEVDQELRVEELKRDEIEARLKQASSEAYIEEMARNKLNMQKEGETVVILADDEQKNLNDESDKQEEQAEKSNWMKWWELIN